MEHLPVASCVLLLLCSICVITEQASHAGLKLQAASPFWFGPRLGRSKRNPLNPDIYSLSILTCEDVEEYVKMIPWDLVTKCMISEGKRDIKSRMNGYVPRLGRDSGEEFISSGSPGAADKYIDNSAAFRETISSNSPPFAPRLG
ncbi:pre-mrna cleavage factor im 25kd subunit [Holotrichia oblita]|uniref:Pre-mrna cleavage factor im 25kd subunit n=1 Tax=Holotrichia oblita TaxID=644536 RepID=A0ACB9TVJ4_HOLOL|nr:pre-mrna cleavage factor im 25kd subunit [Holotrichia oblita]